MKLVREGKPYVMFGDGRLAACKPISEADLAAFMADCVTDPSKANQILPVGGAHLPMLPNALLIVLYRARYLCMVTRREPVRL